MSRLEGHLPRNMFKWASGNSKAEVERSLLYCTKHSIAESDFTPHHKKAVFHESLVQRWREAYADKFPELASSKEVYQKVMSCQPTICAPCLSLVDLHVMWVQTVLRDPAFIS